MNVRVLKITSNGKSALHIPFGYTPLIYKGDVFVMRPDGWDKDNKCWALWLDVGEYVALLLGGGGTKHRQKKDESTPLFGDLDVNNHDLRQGNSPGR